MDWPPHFTASDRRHYDRIQRRRVGRRVPRDVIATAVETRKRWRLNGTPLEEIPFLELLNTMLPMTGGASNFELTLDTTGPAGVTVSINSGASFAVSQSVTLTIATSDGTTVGYQMKVWGDVDPANDANVQKEEAESTWITFAESKAIKLKTGDGSKTIHVRLRDDVWNESSAAEDSITLDTTAPAITVSSGPTPAKISKISSKDTSSFEFQSDTALQAWKVKVVPATSSLHTAGVTIGTSGGSTNMTGGSLAATTNKACTIKGSDLETAAGGDGPWIVKVFGQDEAGNWSTA